jgi:hypothetical protein
MEEILYLLLRREVKLVILFIKTYHSYEPRTKWCAFFSRLTSTGGVYMYFNVVHHLSWIYQIHEKKNGTTALQYFSYLETSRKSII